jgi:hypothetical protein
MGAQPQNSALTRTSDNNPNNLTGSLMFFILILFIGWFAIQHTTRTIFLFVADGRQIKTARKWCQPVTGSNGSQPVTISVNADKASTFFILNSPNKENCRR